MPDAPSLPEGRPLVADLMANLEASVAAAKAARARLLLVHREVPGTRAPDGPRRVIDGQCEWMSDTACGDRVRTSRVTRKPSAITCEECRVPVT